MNNSMEKLTRKQLENLTKEQAFDYAKKLDFNNISNELIYKFSGWKLIEYAESLNFKNVPKFIVDAICKRGGGYPSDYAERMKYKNVPKKIIYKVSRNGRESYLYAKGVGFKNVPKVITDRIAMYPYWSYSYVREIFMNKKLPLTKIDSVKLPQNILNTVKNSGLYNIVLKKGNIFSFNFKDEIEPGKYYKVNVNKCPDELNKEIMEKVFEEENPHVWCNSTCLANFLPFDFTVNNKKYLCVCEYINKYSSMEIIITEYTEPKIQSFSKAEIICDRLWEPHLNNMFFEHCAKIITDNKSERVSHWIKELWLYCGWIQYDRIKPNNKTISYDLMRQYFFGGWGHNYDFFKKDLFNAYTEIKKVKTEIQDKSNDRLAFVKFKIFLRKTMQMLSKQQLTEEKLTNLAKQYLI
jgi:hypothetical protein